MIELDVTDPDQVTSPKRLMVVTGEPGVQLHIFTGIAMTRMYNQDDAGIFGTTSHDRSEHIRVDLGQLPGQMLDFTAQVSLSRIWSYPTLFNLHLTDVWMEHIPGGTLILHSDAQMNGTAGLVAMSYQANIKTREFLAEISGIVRWGSELAATRDADLLEVRSGVAISYRDDCWRAVAVRGLDSGPLSHHQSAARRTGPC